MADLEIQLKAQKECISTLRQRLTDLEGEVQKAYSAKQILIARDRAATATGRANEIISKMRAEDVQSIFARAEHEVAAKESAASPAMESTDCTQLNSEQILIKSVEVLEKATTLIERMELLLLVRDDAQS